MVLLEERNCSGRLERVERVDGAFAESRKEEDKLSSAEEKDDDEQDV